MTCNRALRDSLLEVATKVRSHIADDARHTATIDVIVAYLNDPEIDIVAGTRTYLQPVSGAIANRDIPAIDATYPSAHLAEIHDRIPQADRDMMWQALAMSSMLVSTLQMVPPDMMLQIEKLTSSLMSDGGKSIASAFGGGGGGGGGAIASLLQGLGGSQPKTKRNKRRKKTAAASPSSSARDRFRDALC